MDKKLEQVTETAFQGVEGVYNPTQGLVSRTAKRELFLSHKLFESETELKPRTDKKKLFEKQKIAFELCMISCLLRFKINSNLLFGSGSMNQENNSLNLKYEK